MAAMDTQDNPKNKAAILFKSIMGALVLLLLWFVGRSVRYLFEVVF